MDHIEGQLRTMQWGAATQYDPMMPTYGSSTQEISFMPPYEQQYPEGSVGYEAAKYMGNVSYNTPYQSTYNLGWQNQQNFGWEYEEQAPMYFQNQFCDQNWQPQEINEPKSESSSSIEALLKKYIEEQEIINQQLQMMFQQQELHEQKQSIVVTPEIPISQPVKQVVNIPPETTLESVEHNCEEDFEEARFGEEPEEKLETEIGNPEIVSEKSAETEDHEEVVQSKEANGSVLETEPEEDNPSYLVDSPYMMPLEVPDHQEEKNGTWMTAESESFFLEEPLKRLEHQFPPIPSQQTLIILSYPALRRSRTGWLGLRDVGKLFQCNPG